MINAIRWTKSADLFAPLTPWHIPVGKHSQRRTACGLSIRIGAPIITESIPPSKVCSVCRKAPTTFGSLTMEPKPDHPTHAEIKVATEKFLEDGGVIKRQRETTIGEQTRRIGGDDGWIMGDQSAYFFNV